MAVCSNGSEWRARLARVSAAAASWESNESAAGADALNELAVLAGDADPIVGFAAKEALRRLLRDASAVSEGTRLVRFILEDEGDLHGFRLALLRELINDAEGGEDDASSEDEHEEDRAEPLSRQYVDAVLCELPLVETCVRCTFSGAVWPSAEPRQHEALLFLAALLRQVRTRYSSASSSATARVVPSLNALLGGFVKTVAMPLSFDTAPSSVCCAVLDVMGEWHELVAAARSTGSDEEHGWYRECVSRSTQWLAASSSATMALRMITSSETRTQAASEDAFIAYRNEYPFLQKWLLLLGRLATGVVDTLDEWSQAENPIILQLCRWLQDLASDGDDLLPTRHRILEILSEQDDVMVLVLNSITHTIVKLERRAAPRGMSTGLTNGVEELTEKMLAEWDPDLLFADLLSTFAFDHLVLLDLLTSSETAMLEYLLRYLRRLAGRWTISRRTLAESGQLAQVLGTLIRLRLEIERLTVADLFPYDPTPLIRRLEMVEDAYEAEALTS